MEFYMKKVVFFLMALVMAMGINAQTRPADFRGNLAVWSFTDEIQKMVNDYVRRTYRNLTVNYTQIDADQFSGRLTTAMGSGSGVPDVFALEAAFVRQFVESGQLLDLTDIYEANRARLLAYPVEIGTHNGRVYAMSWQASPGGMFYRRSLARQYLGTDDPNAVQLYFANPAKFLETARQISERSNGSCVIVPSPGEFYNVFAGSRTNPWVVNGRLTIDPAMEQYMDVAKTINDNSWNAGAWQWSEQWFAGMRGRITRDWGDIRDVEVFSYFLPSWGLHYVLKTNAGNTSGDWAMIPGPQPYMWGGTWIAAWKNTPNAALAREFIRYLTTDDAFLERYAKASGDIVSSITVQDKIMNSFRERFLGNQNHYFMFSQMSRQINGRLVQATDEQIDTIFKECVNSFLFEGKTKEQALNDFRARVRSELGIQ
jgi:ABC-type glycerol-3-phosphate transport system substrate-binding protein